MFRLLTDQPTRLLPGDELHLGNEDRSISFSEMLSFLGSSQESMAVSDRSNSLE
jgi:hypothetical protein